MKRMINDDIALIEEKLLDKTTEYHDLRNYLLTKISFYQHERLIHLLVTMLVSLITVILLVGCLMIDNLALLLLLIIFIILLIPYMLHYYFLENKVQYLYKLYLKINERIEK